jgi:hypothetical protein
VAHPIFANAAGLNIKSTSADDDATPAGVGLLTVDVVAVNSTMTTRFSYNAISLDGTTSKVITGVGYNYVESVTPKTWGANNTSSGAIQLLSSGGTEFYGGLAIGAASMTGGSQAALIGEELYLVSLEGSASALTTLFIRFSTLDWNGGSDPPPVSGGGYAYFMNAAADSGTSDVYAVLSMKRV